MHPNSSFKMIFICWKTKLMKIFCITIISVISVEQNQFGEHDSLVLSAITMIYVKVYFIIYFSLKKYLFYNHFFCK